MLGLTAARETLDDDHAAPLQLPFCRHGRAWPGHPRLFLLQLLLKRVLDASGLYRFVWHRALFDLVELLPLVGAIEDRLTVLAGLGSWAMEDFTGLGICRRRRYARI